MNTGFANNYTNIAAGNLASSNMSSAISQLKGSQSPDDAKTAGEKFEGLFLGQLLKLMFDTVPVSEEFGGGLGEETFRQFLVDEYGQIVTAAGGIGIASQIEKGLLEKQSFIDGIGGIADIANNNTSADFAAAAAAYTKNINL